jgi:hypothetical protein
MYFSQCSDFKSIINLLNGNAWLFLKLKYSLYLKRFRYNESYEFRASIVNSTMPVQHELPGTHFLYRVGDHWSEETIVLLSNSMREGKGCSTVSWFWTHTINILQYFNGGKIPRGN